MPSIERVQAFVAAVRDGRFVEAIEDYYDVDASMRENLAPPRVGRDVLVAGEKAVLSGVHQIATHGVGPVLVDGDHVVINWVFQITNKDGSVRRLDELALQTWRGDRIIAEQFYYDPSQYTTPVTN
jgi:ketosteroid isomerase-like protein